MFRNGKFNTDWNFIYFQEFRFIMATHEQKSLINCDLLVIMEKSYRNNSITCNACVYIFLCLVVGWLLLRKSWIQLSCRNAQNAFNEQTRIQLVYCLFASHAFHVWLMSMMMMMMLSLLSFLLLLNFGDTMLWNEQEEIVSLLCLQPKIRSFFKRTNQREISFVGYDNGGMHTITITFTYKRKKRIVNKNESLKVSELIIIIGDSKGQYQTTIER